MGFHHKPRVGSFSYLSTCITWTANFSLFLAYWLGFIILGLLVSFMSRGKILHLAIITQNLIISPLSNCVYQNCHEPALETSKKISCRYCCWMINALWLLHFTFSPSNEFYHNTCGVCQWAFLNSVFEVESTSAAVLYPLFLWSNCWSWSSHH